MAFVTSESADFQTLLFLCTFSTSRRSKGMDFSFLKEFTDRLEMQWIFFFHNETFNWRKTTKRKKATGPPWNIPVTQQTAAHKPNMPDTVNISTWTAVSLFSRCSDTVVAVRSRLWSLTRELSLNNVCDSIDLF